MKEIAPGLFHWTVLHAKIQVDVSSYYLQDAGVLIDPLIPAAGLDAFPAPPRDILLTNRHHYRDSGRIAERYGCTVWCVENGMHEFTHGEEVRPFQFGDILPGNITAIEIASICPDETALYIPMGEGVVAAADGVIRMGEGPLCFVPEEYMGDDPESIKKGLKASYRHLLERDFEHLLLAHGQPWMGGAKEALRKFAEA